MCQLIIKRPLIDINVNAKHKLPAVWTLPFLVQLLDLFPLLGAAQEWVTFLMHPLHTFRTLE